MSEVIAPDLVGAKITAVRDATSDELHEIGIDEPCLVVETDNGIRLACLRDPEGNGAGCLIGMFGSEQFYVSAE